VELILKLAANFIFYKTTGNLCLKIKFVQDTINVLAKTLRCDKYNYIVDIPWIIQ